MIQLEHVDKIYNAFFKNKQVHAVKDLSLEVERGEVFGLLGPNGAGKTTTVKMICTLLKPTGGVIRVAGLEVEHNRREVLGKIGVVLEGTRTAHWPLTVRENLRYYGNLKNVYGKTLKRRIDELVTFMGLEDKANVVVKKLSRGMKQKLAICIALIADPEVLLLDEPTTGIDVATGRSIKEYIRRIAREQHKTVILTTHDMNVAQTISDRIGIISGGKLVALDRTERLIGLFSEQTYQITTAGAFAGNGIRSLPGVEGLNVLPCTESDETMLELQLTSADALYGVLDALKTDNVHLKSVKHKEMTLEEIFLRITGERLPAEDEVAQNPVSKNGDRPA